jgi:Na+-driven multidrug efflux pump
MLTESLIAPSLPSAYETAKEIFKLGWLPICGQLFHPVYLIINVAVCGRISDTVLAGFGLGSLTLGIMLISIGVCFSMGVLTLIS